MLCIFASACDMHPVNNGIGKDGAKYLAVVLACNPSLRKLHIQHNGIGDEGDIHMCL